MPMFLPPLPPSPLRPIVPPLIIEPGGVSPNKHAYSQHLRHGEPIRYTRHANGVLSDDEMNHPPADVYAPRGVYVGFRNTRTNHVYQTPSKFVQHHLPARNGRTNQWDGPSHVRVLRNNQWVQIGTFH